MKRTPLKRTGFTSKPKPMRKVSDNKRAYRASAEGREAAEYMRAVKMLPCVICGRPGPNDAHHCQSGRFSKARSSDFDVISLCPPCHRQEYGPGAYHYSKRAWEAAHGLDTDYIERTRAMVRVMR